MAKGQGTIRQSRPNAVIEKKVLHIVDGGGAYYDCAEYLVCPKCT